MKNTICENEYPELWDLITDDWQERTHFEHRRGSTFFVNYVFNLDAELLPNNPELWGSWITDTIIWDTEYGSDDRILVLYRVEPDIQIIEKKIWKRVE